MAMAQVLPGAECVRQLIFLKNGIVAGHFALPIRGLKRNCGGSEAFELQSADDIQIRGAPGHEEIEIKRGTEIPIRVVPENPCTLFVKDDGAGKPIFLTYLE
jgi:hypothetical protein